MNDLTAQDRRASGSLAAAYRRGYRDGVQCVEGDPEFVIVVPDDLAVPAAIEPEHLTLADGTELRHRTVKSLAEGTRDDSATWSPPTLADRLDEEIAEADREARMPILAKLSADEVVENMHRRAVLREVRSWLGGAS